MIVSTNAMMITGLSISCQIALLLCISYLSNGGKYFHLQCRDPDLGRGHDQSKDRKFMIISRSGGGIGNYLIFYPSAFYFAALTGRDILIADGSLFAEMCDTIQCGFPKYSEAQIAYPALLPVNPFAKSTKLWDFRRHLWGENILTDRIISVDGYKYASGWYGGHNYSAWCIAKLTGCAVSDSSCEDRHAYQKLVRGPFKAEKRLVWMLPCIFAVNFEYLVGPEDKLWPQYVAEVAEFLSSKNYNQGQQLFRTLEEMILQELAPVLQAKRTQAANRRHHRQLLQLQLQSASNSSQKEYENEHSVTYQGDPQRDRIYLYLASDNDLVKEAFAAYLVNHANISVMRVTTGPITHAKDVAYLKSNASNVFALVMDWYALSLANVVFAWRRETGLTSTFAQSAQRASGNAVVYEVNDPFVTAAEESEGGGDKDNDKASKEKEKLAANPSSIRSKGLQLVAKGGRNVWKDFR